MVFLAALFACQCVSALHFCVSKFVTLCALCGLGDVLFYSVGGVLDLDVWGEWGCEGNNACGGGLGCLEFVIVTCEPGGFMYEWFVCVLECVNVYGEGDAVDDPLFECFVLGLCVERFEMVGVVCNLVLCE